MMNLSKNLIVALLGLGCYARCNNINLANNTSILLIILALLAKGQMNEGNGNDTDITRTTNTVTYQSANGNTRTQTVTTQPWNAAYAMPTFTTTSRSCPCNCCNNQCGFTTFQTATPFCTQSVPFSTWNNSCCNGCNGNNFVY